MKTIYRPTRRKPDFGPQPIDPAPIPKWLGLMAWLFLIVSALLLNIVWLVSLGAKDLNTIRTMDQLRAQNQRLIEINQVQAAEIKMLQAMLKQAASVPKTAGIASWLVYERHDTCAAVKWPRGTKLQVTAGESTIVCVVRDYGPNQSMFPNRIVDLSLAQFQQLADPSRGLINVTIKAL